MSGYYIGIDTSCYTTSVACVRDGSIVLDERTVLSVPLGERGLRQSDGVFQHTRNLKTLMERLFLTVKPGEIAGVGVSKAPTGTEQSYMPVFLTGLTAATALAGAAGRSLTETCHQAGHIRAALYGNEALLREERFLAFHLSGGTTDLLLVNRSGDAEENGYRAEGLGGIVPLGTSRDLHIGQYADRLGVALGCSFPAGKELEKLAVQAEKRDIRIPASVRGTDCSFSGGEAQLKRLLEGGVSPAEAAYAAYDHMARTVGKMLLAGAEKTGCGKALLTGGVASSLLLRELLRERIGGKIGLFFGESRLSSDNAVGVALLTEDISGGMQA